MNRPHAAVVLEQTLDHITHTDSPRQRVPRFDGTDATFAPAEFDLDGWGARTFGYGNLTVRAGACSTRRPLSPCPSCARCDGHPHPRAWQPHARTGEALRLVELPHDFAARGTIR